MAEVAFRGVTCVTFNQGPPITADFPIGSVPPRCGRVTHLHQEVVLVQPPGGGGSGPVEDNDASTTGSSPIDPIPPYGHIDLPFTFTFSSGEIDPPPRAAAFFNFAQFHYLINAVVATPRSFFKTVTPHFLNVPLDFVWYNPALVTYFAHPPPPKPRGWTNGTPLNLPKAATALDPSTLPIDFTISFVSDFPTLSPTSPIKFTFRAAPKQPQASGITIKKLVFEIRQFQEGKISVTSHEDLRWDSTLIASVTVKEDVNGQFWKESVVECPMPGFNNPKVMGVMPSRNSQGDLLKVWHRAKVVIALEGAEKVVLESPVRVAAFGREELEKIKSVEPALIEGLLAAGGHGDSVGPEHLPAYALEQ
ncbi:hypothetical protein HK104_004960 [Borealophlyctis nickersoniae]|nr:hypothetical protein HK104_004960 [Borealophlyctis nickersoniae]